jgi:hypothetical protein
LEGLDALVAYSEGPETVEAILLVWYEVVMLSGSMDVDRQQVGMSTVDPLGMVLEVAPLHVEDT